MKAIAKLLLPVIFVSFHSDAIVMRHDKDSDLYQVKDKAYSSVINLDFLMGTLIAPQWIVTAAHGTPLMPGGQELKIAGQNYYVEKIIPYPEYAPTEQDHTHDIALLKLNKPVSGIKSTGIYSQKDELNKSVWFVGSGYTGNGKEGITGMATGLNHAQNMTDKTDNNWLYFDFDSPENGALPLEGISGPGDSGGPAFIKTQSGLKVAGISSHQLDNESGQSGVYGVTEKYTRVSSYAGWIQDTMNKSEQELNKVALERPHYKRQKASDSEKSELQGSYRVESLPTFIIEPCRHTLCYRWDGQPRSTEIYKTADNLWFTNKVNRAIEVIRNSRGEVEKLFFKGYQGDKYAVKL